LARQINLHTMGSSIRYRMNQECIPKHELIIYTEGGHILRILHPQGPHDRKPFTMGLIEESIPEGQQGVPLA
jgi:hypothetical protein